MKLVKYIIGFVLTGALFTSCIKDDAPALGDRGTSFIKILEAPTNNLYFSPFTTIDTVHFFSLRRDEPSSTLVSESKTYQLMIDTAAITAYNDANGTDYEALPDSLYTLLGDNVSVSGEMVTMTMPSDVIGSDFMIALDGSKWDVTHKYAMDFVITDSAGTMIRTGENEVFVTVEAKNQWDGVYEVTGTLSDGIATYLKNINIFLGSDGPMQYELRTLSPTKCASYDNFFFGGYYVPLTVDNGDGTYDYSYYGSFSPVFEFDPATNAVVGVTNYYGQPAGNTRSAQIDPSGENVYDPSTKTMSVKYWMNQPSSVPDPPNHRTSFEEVWTYIGPRG